MGRVESSFIATNTEVNTLDLSMVIPVLPQFSGGRGGGGGAGWFSTPLSSNVESSKSYQLMFLENCMTAAIGIYAFSTAYFLIQ